MTGQKRNRRASAREDAVGQLERAQCAEARAQAAEARAKFFLANIRRKEGRCEAAGRLLNEIPQEHRHFEWYLTQRLLPEADLILYGCGGLREEATFSPDGSLLAARYSDGILVWETQSGSLIWASEPSENCWIRRMGFNSEGTKLVALVELENEESDEADALSEIRVWDGLTGSLLNRLTNASDEVFDQQVDGDTRPDHSNLSTTKSHEQPESGDLESGGQSAGCDRTIQQVKCSEISPNGQQLILGGGSDDKGELELVDLRSGQTLWYRQAGPVEVQCVKFTPDGKRVMTGGFSWPNIDRWSCWDVDTGSRISKFQLHDSAGIVDELAVDFSPDGSLAVFNDWGQLKLLDISTTREAGFLRGHDREVSSVSISPDGTVLASGSWDQTVKLWDVETGKVLRSLTGHGCIVRSVSFSPDGRFLVSSSGGPFDKEDNTLKVWDVMTGEQVRVLEGHTEGVRCARFSPDGKQIASASYDRTVRLWDAESGDLIWTRQPHADWILSVEFNSDGTRMVTGSEDNTAKILDATSGDTLLDLSDHGSEVWSAIFVPRSNDSQIMTASEDESLKLWDASTGQCIRTFTGHADKVYCVAISPDGTRIASGSQDHTIILWDFETGQELMALKGHSELVGGVAFSRDGQILFSASFDGLIGVWNGRATQEVRTLHQTEYGLASGRVSSDGAVLEATRYGRKRKLFFDLNTGKEIRDRKVKSAARKLDFSGNERWLFSNQGYGLVIDQEYKNLPLERARRERLTCIKPHWHQEQAQSAEESDNWFAAAFHRAWIVRARPDNLEAYDNLHRVHRELLKQDEVNGQQQASLLPPAVKDALAMPRPVGSDDSEALNQ